VAACNTRNISLSCNKVTDNYHHKTTTTTTTTTITTTTTTTSSLECSRYSELVFAVFHSHHNVE
jgi:hypothetical protein